LGGALGATTTITQAGNNMIFNLDGLGDFDIQDFGVSAFFVQDNGRVGIGDNVPFQQMEIKGGTTAWTLGGDDPGVDNLYLEDHSGADVDGGVGGSISFSGPGNGGSGARRHAAIAGVQETTETDYVGLAFYTHNNITSTANMQESVRISHDGKMGIGTTLPQGNLDVRGTANTRLLQTQTTTGEIFFAGGNGGAVLMGGWSAGDHLGITVANVEKMRILTDGNVGIGTSTPGAKLEVAGQVKITGGAPGAGKVLTSDAAGLAAWEPAAAADGNGIYSGSGSLSGATTVTQGANNMIFNLDGLGDFDIRDFGTSAFFVRDDGNVGIGTNAPQYSAHFKKTGTTPTTILNLHTSGTTADQAAILRFTNTTANPSDGTYSSYIAGVRTNVPVSGAQAIAFATSASSSAPTERMRIDPNGNVGIGLTNPGELLHVNGNIAVADAIRFGNTGTLVPSIEDDTGGDGPDWLNLRARGGLNIVIDDDASNGVSDEFQIWDDEPGTGDILFHIEESGNVGIGTSTPGTKLEVAGQVKITGGTPGAGQVLTSDASGLATWEPATGGPVASGKTNVSGTLYAGADIQIDWDNTNKQPRWRSTGVGSWWDVSWKVQKGNETVLDDVGGDDIDATINTWYFFSVSGTLDAALGLSGSIYGADGEYWLARESSGALASYKVEIFRHSSYVTYVIHEY
ncbi:MAG: hypothetical protein JKY18_04705, partial [Flavobacteriales bacterium]|nr:hypothetical protein [Flavobacteriales bacterium]